MKQDPRRNTFVKFLLKDMENGKEFYNSCIKMAKRWGINREDAEDAYQNFLIKMITIQPVYDPKITKLKTYPSIVVKRTYIDFLRKRKHTKNFTSITMENKETGEEYTSIEPESKTPSPLETLTIKEEIKKLFESIEELVPNRKEIIQLRQSGMTYEQIANFLNIPMGTVKNRINRSRKTLVKLLTPIIQ